MGKRLVICRKELFLVHNIRNNENQKTLHAYCIYFYILLTDHFFAANIQNYHT
jgi:hypothetical protein